MDIQKDYKILIVDDQPKNIQVLGSLLREEQFIVGVAMNGKEAIDTLKESDDYDLVLMDVNMPEMDGFEACKAIRKIDKLEDIPVIFLTALTETDNIIKGFDAGGQDYVTKPFNSKELLARVYTHLELKQSRDHIKQMNHWLEQKVQERTKELSIANEKLLQLDTAKSQFLNIISHEIRTPLNGIIGILSVMDLYELPPDVAGLLDVMKQSADRLESFSYKALDISLFNTKGANVLDVKPTAVNKLINSIIPEHKSAANQKKMIISLVSKTKDSIITIDETYIKKSFSYIIDNAIKYGNEGTLIIIQISRDEGYLKISFENSGDGFPEDFNISDVQPFQTDKHIDKNPALSLYSCKQIIQAHNGIVETQNTAQGVVVDVHLPII